VKEDILSTVEQAIECQAKARDTIRTIEKTVLYQFGNCHGDAKEREKRLKESVKFIEDVLNNSSSQDEYILSMMLGRLLMSGLALQYDEIRNELEDLKSIWRDGKLEGLSKERLEPLIVHIGRRIESICDKIVYKAGTEETILKTAWKALQQGVDYEYRQQLNKAISKARIL